MFELTSLLVTISAASASFVAILGGFIASKLLSISGERELTEEQLINVNKEIQLLKEQNNLMQYKIDEDDALDYIKENIEKIIQRKSIDEAYSNSEHEIIEKEVLKTFWERALSVFQEFKNSVGRNVPFNGDNVPEDLAIKYKNKNFEYTICKEIHKFYSNQRLGYLDVNLRMVKLYDSYKEQIYQNKEKLKSLYFKQEQLQEKEKMLKAPKGVKLGFLVFAIFTILCVVAPLCFVPFKTENYGVYLAVLYSFIGIFILGLVSVFLYLLYLLSWKKLDKAKNCK